MIDIAAIVAELKKYDSELTCEDDREDGIVNVYFRRDFLVRFTLVRTDFDALDMSVWLLGKDMELGTHVGELSILSAIFLFLLELKQNEAPKQ